MGKNTIDYFEVEELAADLCGIENEDSSETENALYEKFDINMEQLHPIIEALMKRITIGVSPMTSTAFVGFTDEQKSMWVLKKTVDEEFLNSVIQWLTGGDDLDPKAKGFKRTVTKNGEPEYEIIIRRPEGYQKEQTEEQTEEEQTEQE